MQAQAFFLHLLGDHQDSARWKVHTIRQLRFLSLRANLQVLHVPINGQP